MSGEEEFALPDWSSDVPYAYTDRLSGSQWAWEFLRRNAEFRADWRVAQLQYGLSGYDPPMTMMVSQYDTPMLSKWGLLYCTSPNEDARTAAAFWNPALCSTVLRLKGFPVTENIDTTPFVLDDLKCPSVLLEMPSGGQHLLFMDEGRRLQLAIEGADVMRPVRLLTNGAPEKDLALSQLAALRCFNDLRLSARLYDSHIERGRGPERLHLVLRILDANFSGATRDEIARKLFADEYIDEGWSGANQLLRDRVRRAIYRGRALMCKAYRTLLA
ncbi:MAG TPA: DUF2285 domain-containing protein [Terriglobales bacterium]|nr:DUF2285 domain-containing protein [Terriglobales bacterium]